MIRFFKGEDAQGLVEFALVLPPVLLILVFGLVELVRDRAKKVPLAPFNGTSDEMAALGKFFRQEGLYTIVRWNTFFTNPPLCITEAELREAFAIIDQGLEITDRAVA